MMSENLITSLCLSFVSTLHVSIQRSYLQFTVLSLPGKFFSGSICLHEWKLTEITYSLLQDQCPGKLRKAAAFQANIVLS